MKSLVDEVTDNMDYLLKLEESQKTHQRGDDLESSEDEEPVFELKIRPPKVLCAVPSSSEEDSDSEHSSDETRPISCGPPNKQSDSDSPGTPSPSKRASASSKRSHHTKKQCPMAMISDITSKFM